MIKGLILAMAGVLYQGRAALPGAADALRRPRALGGVYPGLFVLSPA